MENVTIRVNHPRLITFYFPTKPFLRGHFKTKNKPDISPFLFILLLPLFVP
jgi:hypothetical protein